MSTTFNSSGEIVSVAGVEGASFVCTARTSKLFSILIFCVFAGLLLPMVFYRGTFKFWKYPLSDLGAMMTEDGTPNVLSRVMFDAAMMISAVLMLRISFSFAGGSQVSHSGMKRTLAIFGGAGFLLMLAPYDVYLTIHVIGGLLVFSSLWGMTVIASFELKKSSHRIRAVLILLVSQVTVLPYGVLFAAGVPSEVVAQKFAVAGLMFSVWLSTRVDQSPGHLRSLLPLPR